MKRTFFALAGRRRSCSRRSRARAKLVSHSAFTIQSCVVNQSGNGATNGINVVYYNTQHAPTTEVDFSCAINGIGNVLIDVGTFTHGTRRSSTTSPTR